MVEKLLFFYLLQMPDASQHFLGNLSRQVLLGVEEHARADAILAARAAQDVHVDTALAAFPVCKL